METVAYRSSREELLYVLCIQDSHNPPPFGLNFLFEHHFGIFRSYITLIWCLWGCLVWGGFALHHIE